jgi:hypothetical protein
VSAADSEVLERVARGQYAAAGYPGAGVLELVPVSGRDAPNVLPFVPRDRREAREPRT